MNDTELTEFSYTIYDTIALDDLEEGDKLHAYTLNPNPSRYNSKIVEKQYAQIFYALLHVAPKVFSKFCFTPELTELGNVHIHGWYVIKDRVKYHKFWLPKSKSMGFVRIKYKDITEEWFEYIEKDMDFMNEMIEDLPVPYTHKDKTPYLKYWNSKKQMESVRRYEVLKKKGPKVKRSVVDYFSFDEKIEFDSEDE